MHGKESAILRKQQFKEKGAVFIFVLKMLYNDKEQLLKMKEKYLVLQKKKTSNE